MNFRKSNLTTRNRYLLLLFTLLYSIFIYTARVHSSEAEISFISYLPIWAWIVMCLATSVGTLTVLILRHRILGIYVSFLLAVMFLFLPTFVTGSLYGPDSYTKAAGVNRILQTHHVNFNIYPAAEVFSSVAILITDSSVVSVPFKLGAALLSPPITYVTVSSLNNGSYGIPARWALVFSSLLPLGMGMWLSTRSTYHNFYLTLPVAVLMLFSFIRFKRQSDFRWAVLFAGIGLILLLYHPLGLISIIGAILIIDVIAFDSLNLYTYLPVVRDKNPAQNTKFVLLLTVIYCVVFAYFQFVPSGKTSLINKLVVIDVLSFDATTNRLSISIFDSQN